MRTVTVKDIIYIRAADVGEYIRELAATEETDVRDRLYQAALNLQLINTNKDT